MLHRQKAALQIDRENALPGILRNIDNAADFRDADIVVENINALEGFQRAHDCRSNIGGLGHIRPHRQRHTAFISDQRGSFLRRREVDIRADDPGAVTRECQRRGFAVAPARANRAGAEHQRSFIVEP